MKNHRHIKIALTVALLCGSLLAADSIETMNRKVTGSTSAAGIESKAVAAYALVSRDNTIALSAYGSVLTVEGANFDNHQTSLIFDEPTADRSLKFSNASGRVDLAGEYVAKTATGTLTAAECYGGIITNAGASGGIVLTLPTPVKGMHLRVYLTVAQDVDLNAANGTQILSLTNATGDAASSDAAIGSFVELIAISATQWQPVAKAGTWTDVN